MLQKESTVEDATTPLNQPDEHKHYKAGEWEMKSTKGKKEVLKVK